ncbi:archaeal proteasome endopeptidase complex subunit alpha [Candidatus Pacearchaeota archaeon]|nr:MAG: archaeal proteasome endopeptidase complex subunit alpha [Candidatus Pacearchaeota archaeon]
MEDIHHQQMGYDRAATMFAPDGQILQVEYAEKTVRLGSASIAIIFKDGVVIVSDRRRKDPLVVESSANKINIIDDHIMAVAAGISSDARVLIERARVAAQQHRITYDSTPDAETIVREIADIKQQFTQYGGARPFGVSIMVAGYNSEPTIHTTDITGNYFKYRANAIGENDEQLKEILRKKYKKDLPLKDAVKLAFDAFREVQKDGFDPSRFDVGVLTKEGIEILPGKKFA